MEKKMKWILVFVMLIAVLAVFLLATGDVKLAAAMAVIGGFNSAMAFVFGISNPKDK